MTNAVNDMEDTIRMSMLLEFYGVLLTDKQREYLDMYYNENLSLTEIAEREEISKQGVHELISRAEKKLLSIEQKTGFMQKWSGTRSVIETVLKNGEEIHPAVIEYFEL